MVSERLERLGCAPCEGDLVIDDAEDMILEEEAALEAETVVAVETGAVGKKGGRSTESSASSSSSSSASSSGCTPVVVKRLTASDISSGAYTIYDVVMPLPGANSTYPSHAVGREMYEQMMGSEGVTPDALLVRLSDKRDADTGNLTKRYMLEGGYRKILRRVTDAETAVVWYDSEDQQLQPTDRDILHYGG